MSSVNPINLFCIRNPVFLACLFPAALSNGQDVESLGKYVVLADRVANAEPGSSYPQVISALRFDPQIDLQTRNHGEAQGDIALRGGIFESTAFKFGAISIFDPQTGHYAAEIPISPAMTTGHAVKLGLDNAFSGFNATVGTLQYGFSRIKEGFHGVLSAGIGENEHNREGLLFSLAKLGESGNRTVGMELDLARSESDGSLPYGDHRFNRAAGRFQIAWPRSQTDFFAGYQSKFFGWPNMYTPFGRNETENLQTRLFLATHRIDYGSEDFIEASGYFRGHRDHYVFDRLQPQVFEAFHETRVFAGGVEGRHRFAPIDLHYTGQFLSDEIDSSALLFGDFQSRRYLKVAAGPEVRLKLSGNRELTLKGGVGVDWTNRDGTSLSPGVGGTLTRTRGEGRSEEFYLEFGTASQVPGYTAIASNPSGGLFRGNSGLGREKSRNLEGGVRLRREDWSCHFAIWQRWDRDMLDWTFSFASASARTANPIDINTTGVELGWRRDWDNLALVLGYTYLAKSRRSAPTGTDASFYALNYPRHRLTTAVVWQPVPAWVIRFDNEFRDQEENPLRDGPTEAVISYLTATWQSAAMSGFDISFAVDNLFDSRFEEIPAVPASPRQVSLRASYRW